MEKYEIMRAKEEWQRAGAYFVRIQGMNRKYHISLREEFDEYDNENTKYIVILDDGYPIATCRFYKNDDKSVILGRVVVLPEYRGKKLGHKVVLEAEKWIRQLGFTKIIIDSRVNVTNFYEKIGYKKSSEKVNISGVFECIRMIKILS